MAERKLTEAIDTVDSFEGQVVGDMAALTLVDCGWHPGPKEDLDPAPDTGLATVYELPVGTTVQGLPGQAVGRQVLQEMMGGR